MDTCHSSIALEISSKKLEITGEHFMQRRAKKDRNGMDLTEAEGIKKRWQEYIGKGIKVAMSSLNFPSISKEVIPPR